jgi:hypothetical protein
MKKNKKPLKKTSPHATMSARIERRPLAVRIDGTVSPEHLNRSPEKTLVSTSKSHSARERGACGVLESITAQIPLTQVAGASPDINVQAVEEARQALRSGTLDTPEAARRAAQALLDSGL